MLNAPALVQAAGAQQPVTQPTAAVHALLPPVPSFPGRIHQRSPISGPLYSHPDRAQTIHGRRLVWSRPTFAVPQTLDSDGDTRQDSVFITVWKQWDFYLGWTARARAGLAGRRMGTGSSACSNATAGNTPVVPSARSTGSTPGLVVLYRPMRKALPVHGPRWRWGDEDGAQTPPPSRPASKRGAGCWTMCAKAPPRHAHHRCGRPCMKQLPLRASRPSRPRPVHRALQRLVGQRKKRPVGRRPVLDGRTPACLHQGEPWGRAFQAELEKR